MVHVGPWQNKVNLDSKAISLKRFRSPSVSDSLLSLNSGRGFVAGSHQTSQGRGISVYLLRSLLAVSCLSTTSKEITTELTIPDDPNKLLVPTLTFHVEDPRPPRLSR